VTSLFIEVIISRTQYNRLSQQQLGFELNFDVRFGVSLIQARSQVQFFWGVEWVRKCFRGKF